MSGCVKITSDRTLKENIVTLDNGLNKVLSMRGVYFDWINKEEFHDRRNIGFIAQEVEAVCPELVITNNNGIKQVNYSQMVSVLIEGIKDQQNIINSLSARLDKLETPSIEEEVQEVKPKAKKAKEPKEPKEKKAKKAKDESVV